MDSRWHKALIWKVAVLLEALVVSGFTPAFVLKFRSVLPPHLSGRYHLIQRTNSQVLDAEFERVDDNSRIVEDSISSGSKSLFELSLEADSDLNATRIPFFDGDSFIDTRLAFLADLDGETYGIGIAYEHPAAITVERKDGSISHLSPDSDENEEVMEIMAVQLQQHVGEDLQLKRTPRILTISGPLEQYTKNWREELAPKAADRDVLLDESDEDLEFFHEFMKEQLGEEVYEETLKESSDDLSPDIIELFNIPGLGDQEDDVEGMKELFQSTLLSPEEQQVAMKQYVEPPDHEGVALKLISYIFREGKSYSLVNLLKPYVLIGKCVREDHDDVRFELLSPSEEKLLVPQLEKVCMRDLQQAGLKLKN